MIVNKGLTIHLRAQVSCRGRRSCKAVSSVGSQYSEVLEGTRPPNRARPDTIWCDEVPLRQKTIETILFLTQAIVGNQSTAATVTTTDCSCIMRCTVECQAAAGAAGHSTLKELSVDEPIAFWATSSTLRSTRTSRDLKSIGHRYAHCDPPSLWVCWLVSN